MTDQTRPPPLVPPEVDLRDFATMPLDVQMLRDSRFAGEVSGDAFRAGVMLWCAAWHQVPCGSLPDNDAELSKLAGYGFAVREWRRVKQQAMQGCVLCSDGRWYHGEVSARALIAWRSRLEHYYERAKDRLRKTNGQRKEQGLPALPPLSFDQWNEARTSSGIPMERADAVAGIPPPAPPIAAGIPPEKALKGKGTEQRGNGEGEGTDCIPPSAPVGAGAAAPPPGPPGPDPTPVDTIFAVGLPMLQQAKVPERNARTFLGHLRKVAKHKGGDAAVVAALNACAKAQVVDPVTYLQACFAAKPNGSTQPDLDELTAGVQRRLGIAPSQETIDG